MDSVIAIVWILIGLVVLKEILERLCMPKLPKLTKKEQELLMLDCIAMCREMHRRGILDDMQLLTILGSSQSLLTYVQEFIIEMIPHMPHIENNPRVQFILNTDRSQLI